jgi:lysophospholipase L1-like esterase
MYRYDSSAIMATVMRRKNMTAGHPELLWEDGIHLTPDGADAHAKLVAPVVAAALAPLQSAQ